MYNDYNYLDTTNYIRVDRPDTCRTDVCTWSLPVDELIQAKVDETIAKRREETLMKAKTTPISVIPAIKKYIVNDNTTIVFFEDGTKKIAKCCPDDKFDLEAGIEVCICKKIFGDNYRSKIKQVIRKSEKLKEEKQKLEEKEKADRLKRQEKIAKNVRERLERIAKQELELEKLKESLKLN